MLRWLREPLPPGPRYGYRVVAWTGVLALTVVVLALPTGSALQARAALSAIGLLLVLMAQLRPSSFWEVGNVPDWRLVLGDRLTVLAFTLIGLGIAVWSWLVGLPGS